MKSVDGLKDSLQSHAIMTIDLDFRQRQTIVIYDEDNGDHEVLLKKDSRRLSVESKICMVSS